MVQTDTPDEGQWFKQIHQMRVSGSDRYTSWGSVVQTDTPAEGQWFRQIHQLRVSGSDRYTSWGSAGQTDTPDESQWFRQIHQLRVSGSDRYIRWESVVQTDTPNEGQWFLGRKDDETEVTITVTIQVCKLTDCTLSLPVSQLVPVKSTWQLQVYLLTPSTHTPNWQGLLKHSLLSENNGSVPWTFVERPSYAFRKSQRPIINTVYASEVLPFWGKNLLCVHQRNDAKI